MTMDEYFALSLIVRLEAAYSILIGDEPRLPQDDDGPHLHLFDPDLLVFADDGIGIHISDVIHDAIIKLKE